MNINVKTLNISLTPAISDYVEKKMAMLNKFIDLEAQNVMLHVQIGKTSKHHKSGDFFKAEVDLHSGKANFHAESEKDDLYAAIDDVKDEIAREIKTRKEKKISNKRRGGAEVKKFVKREGADSE